MSDAGRWQPMAREPNNTALSTRGACASTPRMAARWEGFKPSSTSLFNAGVFAFEGNRGTSRSWGHRCS